MLEPEVPPAPPIVAENGKRARAWPTRTGLAESSVATVLVALLLVVSLRTTLSSVGNGLVVLGWTAVWSIAAAVASWYLRSWRWTVVCPLTMVTLLLMWGIIFGPTYWGSTYVVMLGMIFAVSACAGALLGTWWGTRRASR